MPEAPQLSIVAVFHDMRREAARTLHSMSADYQLGVASNAWEVIAIDNGSSDPLGERFVRQFGERFRYLALDTQSPSPAGAVNAGVAASEGSAVAISIDGARILSPGVVGQTLRCFGAFSDPLVSTLGFHLGSELQNDSIGKGYDAEAEDQLIESIEWPADGYRLFEISALAGSSEGGWFSTPSESNFLAMSREAFDGLAGFDEEFQSPGGGLVNLDFYRRACERPGAQPVMLLGEGTFHQVHGGVATNVPREEHPWQRFHEEYMRLRGESFRAPEVSPCYFGSMPAPARRFLNVIR